MTSGRWRRNLRTASVGAALLLLGAATAQAKGRDPMKIPGAQYEPVTWAAIDGWADDDHGEAFEAFLQSCKAILQGAPSGPMGTGLFHVCQKAVVANPQKPGEARLFFEKNFRPVRISPLGTPDGFLTGYYEPIVEGTREKSGAYEFPLYRKPGSLVGGQMQVAAASGGKKKKIKRKRMAFYDRAAIDDGVLAGRDLEICWLKDPIDSFFIHIQGSVRVLMDDGKLMRLNYAAANGHPYYAVGRWLIDKGIVPKDEMSMDRIRQWMERNPEEGRTLRRMNKSYVFFRETQLPSNQEPVGAQGVSLTPGRSIAVDRKLHTYGTPFFISAQLPIQSMKPDTWFKRLMIAQDTGGAIVGPARADIYFGAGDEAESVAGRLRHSGKFVMLMPREVDPAADSDEIPLPQPRPEIPVASEAPADAAPATAEVKAEPAKPEPEKPKVSAAATAEPEKHAVPDKSTKEKPAKVAARTPEPASKKVAAPADHAVEKKKTKAQTKTAAKIEAKTDAKADGSKAGAWEARVMPKIEYESADKTPKSKTKR